MNKLNTHFTIPEIYGESLSYYETLDKLIGKVNELVKNYNTVPQQVTEAVAENLQGFEVPQTYGAKGDGITDDTDALQLAIDTATNNGATLYLPTGVYIVDPNKGISLRENTHIVGNFEKTVIKAKPQTNVLNNIVKAESVNYVIIEGVTIDGSRSTMSETDTVSCNYGLYFAKCQNCRISNVIAKDLTGVGVHLYDCNYCTVSGCIATNNAYHGFECEQTRNTVFSKNFAYKNSRSGFVLTPGEVNGTGSHSNRVTGNVFSLNNQYGVLCGAGNNELTKNINTGNSFTDNTIEHNNDYQVCLYDSGYNIITDNTITAYAGALHSVYCYNSSYNVISSNIIAIANVNNSESRDKCAILLENGSTKNLIAYNRIKSNYSNYAIQDNTHDSVNYYLYNYIGTGTIISQISIPSGNKSVITTLSTDDPKNNLETLRTFTDGVNIKPGATLPGNTMGLDAPFGDAVLRLFKDNGNIQIVTPAGNIDMYVNGNNTFSAYETRVSAHGHRVTELADATEDADAVTLKQLNNIKSALDTLVNRVTALENNNA